MTIQRCDAGVCLLRPAGTPRPVSLYMEMAGTLGVYGGGTWYTVNSDNDGDGEANSFSGSLTPRLLYGGRLAFLVGVRRWFHVGVYSAIQFGDLDMFLKLDDGERRDTTSVITGSVGLALKLGGRVKEKGWIGLAMDTGVSFMNADCDNDNSKVQAGFVWFPRLNVDVWPGGYENRGVGIGFGVGLKVANVHGEVFEDTDKITTRWTWVQPMALLGLVFGRRGHSN